MFYIYPKPTFGKKKGLKGSKEAKGRGLYVTKGRQTKLTQREVSFFWGGLEKKESQPFSTPSP